MTNPEPKKKPLQRLELIFLLIAASPGILLFTNGRAQTAEQAFFRSAVFLAGLIGFIGVKIYQRRKVQ